MTIKCPKCYFDNPEDTIYCGKCATSLSSLKDISVSQTKTSQAPTKELTTGSTFAGRYQVIEELGKGGMGKVYKVNDTKIKEKVALKLIKPEVASDKENIERFSNELKLARKISHRNVQASLGGHGQHVRQPDTSPRVHLPHRLFLGSGHCSSRCSHARAAGCAGTELRTGPK